LDDRVRRLLDRRVWAVLNPDITRGVPDRATHEGLLELEVVKVSR
jgi:hypothetical protein